jgi:predicted transposase/invertase (TIGR01784 family)
MPTPPPHDALFKAAFGQPDLARSELELVLPVEIQAHLDLATLEISPGSFVDDDLRHAHTDLLYRVRTRADGDALVYLLMEHQSTFDARMPLRLLRYMVRVWDRWERDHPTAKLPIVLPVVLHHDRAAWRAAPELAAILDAGPDLLAAVRPYQPLFRFVLDDLAPLSLEALASRKLHALALLVEMAFWASRSLARLEDAAPRMAAIVGEVSRDARARMLLTQLYVYLAGTTVADIEPKHVRAIIEQIAGPGGKEEIVNLFERERAAGEAEGLAKGQAEGLAKGQAEGLAKGQAEGLRVAVAATMAARGMALTERGRAQLAACSDVKLLTRWVTNAATAASEAEVFGARQIG